ERSVIFYLTARNEGARPPEETLSLVCASAPELRFCSLEAKEKICIYDGDNNGSDGTKKKDGSRKCDPNNCPYAKHHFDNEPAAIKEAIGSERNFIDREFVRELSAKHMVCPFELMLDLTLFCDVVIGDYNYLFDPESYLKRWFSDESGRYYFLIDEAHQLPDRVRTMYSSSISSDALMRCTKGKKRQKIGKKLVKMAGLCSEFQIDEGSEKEFLKELDESADLALEYLEDHDDEKLLDLCFEMLHFKTVSAYIQSGGSILHHSDIDGGTVSVYCMDPSVIIREKCGQSDGAVLFSATLLPENYYKSELGGEDMPFVSVRSPFPEENMLALAGTFADTRYRAREASLPGIASFIENLSKSVKKGNYIVFFSSYAFMESVYSLLDKNFRTEAVFMQPRKSVQADRSAFVSGFTEGPEKLHIGFCVLGGSFSEGLDLPGDRLSGAVIVGTGLPQVGEYTELLRAYYDSNNRAGFESAYFYPGVNKVIQAAGRVIRSHEDRGFVLFLDSRYARRDHIDAISNCYRYTVCRDPEKVISMIVDFISEI
ncbi:MAG: ATP-dependent DNA helicase, partial [Clostridia bacterium]|nr:ATP-dependent DNA helicase [Clostridia bacterium]